MVPEVGGSKPLGHPTADPAAANVTPQPVPPTPRATRRRARVRELVAALLEHASGSTRCPLTSRCSTSSRAVHRLQRQQRGRQHGRAVHRGAERARELGVGRGVRRGEVGRRPCTESFVRRCRSAPTWSSRAIQLMYCSPEPIRPPSPSLKGRSIRWSAPPWAASTMPVRRCTTRIPASSAAAGGGLPGHADLGGEVGAGRRLLDQLLGALVAVVADRRAREQHLRRAGEAGQGPGEEGRCPGSGSRG